MNNHLNFFNFFHIFIFSCHFIIQQFKKVCAVVFITLEVPSSSNLAKGVSIVINFVIILAVLSYILSTEKYLRVVPLSCDMPVCNDDINLCPGSMLCADEAAHQFDVIDRVCTFLFTIEYGLRILTCWSVTPR